MLDYFTPDLYFDTIYSVTPSLLKKHGIKNLLLDIDNTLVTYDDPYPTESVEGWFADMKEAGIKIAFVSNNHSDRVLKFASKTDFPAFPDAHKLRRDAMITASEKIGAKRENTAVIGDQIFTDVFAGKRIGYFTVLVKPLKDKTDIFTKMKRVGEKPIIANYYKKKL